MLMFLYFLRFDYKSFMGTISTKYVVRGLLSHVVAMQTAVVKSTRDATDVLHKGQSNTVIVIK